MLVWLSVWSKVQTCIWPGWCHCHSLSFASVKSRLVLPFWYRLTRVVPDGQRAVKWVCVYKYKYWTELSLTGSLALWTYHICTCQLPARPAPDDSCTCDNACWTDTHDHASLDCHLQCHLPHHCHHVSCEKQPHYVDAALELLTQHSSSPNCVQAEMTQ